MNEVTVINSKLTQIKEFLFPEAWKPKFSLGVWNFDHRDYLAIDFFGLVVQIPIVIKAPSKNGMASHLGFLISRRSLTLGYWKDSKVLYFPWSYVITDHDVLRDEEPYWGPIVTKRKDGTLYAQPHFKNLLKRDAYKDGRLMHQCPYQYTKKDNKIQYTMAAFWVGRYTYRWRILRRFKRGPVRYRHFIEGRFKNEIGENVGKFGGGVQRFRFDIQTNENPFQTISRMETVRKFP